jgi:hypothetical protein
MSMINAWIPTSSNSKLLSHSQHEIQRVARDERLFKLPITSPERDILFNVKPVNDLNDTGIVSKVGSVIKEEYVD